MKLRNKTTGEILDVKTKYLELGLGHFLPFDSLAELSEEWEDYEEPFSFSFYTIVDGEIKHCIFYREKAVGCPDDAWAYIKDDGRESIKQLKAVGMYFETKEEAEKAVEKLKAWKRLKDKKFEFTEWYKPDGCEPFIVVETNIDYDDVDNEELQKDLDLLFGGEE